MSERSPPPPPDEVPELAALDAATRADRHELVGLRERILSAKARGRPFDRNLARLLRQLARSAERKEKRRAGLPTPTFPDELPVSGKRDEIAAAIASHAVTVVCGETGSGKSTQLPKILLGMGYGADGLIGHTQPRRIAARTLAARIADELGSPLGRDVGFKVRFTDETGPDTYVKLMTDGVLLAETRSDPFLLAYDAILVDEAHERSLNIDFLLGYLLRLLARRKDLKVVITSATLDPQRFAEHFTLDGRAAPIVEVTGRTYPVEVLWRPTGEAHEEEGGEEGDSGDPHRPVVEGVLEVCRHGDGDVLVFLPTQRDIVEVGKLLEGRRLPGPRPAEILPLFARLPVEKQQAVFATDGTRRRIVLATNVAESSVTVPGIRYVVDTGLARIARYTPRARVQRLPIEPVSRASADQRKGRCGRVGPGVCLRLYSEDDYDKREAYTQPEIQRSNLAAVVLQMLAFGLGRVEDFPFLDPPKRSQVQDGLRTLLELGALDDLGRLTERGKRLSRLPVDPRLGRMLLAGADEGCLAEMLVIVSALETADPRERPPGKEAAADRAHAAYADVDSDLLALLKLWDAVSALAQQHGRRKLAKALKERFLSPPRVREWMDVQRQLGELLSELELRPGARRDDATAVHRAVLSGLLANVATKTSKYEYEGTDGKQLFLWPGSTLFEKKPRWIVATEVVETARRYARGIGRIDPQWVEEFAGPLCQRTYTDPRWDKDRGRVMALERVTFGGLVLVPKRLAPYDTVDRALSRELFIRHALAEGQLRSGAPFLEHNLDLVNAVAALEAKTRQRGLLADLELRYDFYDRRLPAEVCSAQSFHRWRKKVEQHDPGLLYMSRDELLRGDDGVSEASYPDTLRVDGNELPLRYRFAPGDDDDGVTLVVPVELLDRVDAERLEWLVPGMLREKVIALMRSLPKPLRRTLVPLPEAAVDVTAALAFGEGRLLDALADAASRVGGIRIAAADFRETRLPDHLLVNVLVLGDAGRVLAKGRDLSALRAQLGRQVRAAVSELSDDRWQRDGITGWEFGELPEKVSLRQGRVPVTAFPALVDMGESVALRLLPRRDEAEAATRGGLARLLALALRGRVVHRVERFAGWQTMVLQHATLGDGKALQEQIVRRVVQRAALADAPVVRDTESFGRLVETAKARLVPAVDAVVEELARVLAAHHEVRRRLDELADRPWGTVLAACEAHLALLTGPRAFSHVPDGVLAHVPRYLAGIARRLDRVAQRGTQRDAELAEQVRPFVEACEALVRAAGGRTIAEVDDYRWTLEEFRVSVFAQELGTAVTVSAKRLDGKRRKAEAAVSAVGVGVGSEAARPVGKPTM